MSAGKTNKKGWYFVMAELNSYLGMAFNDYLFAKGCMVTGDQINNYNCVASLCAQSAEKYLKAVIEVAFIQDSDVFSLLKSHNLRAIYNKIIVKYEMNVSSKDCKWLGDFYYDTGYPGDYFIIVNRQDALECLSIVERIAADVKRILDSINDARCEDRSRMGELRAFPIE